MVIINTISKEAFHALASPEVAAELDIGSEVEWYADLGETVLGTVGEGEPNEGWSYAALHSDASGNFRVYARQHHFPTWHTARMELFRHLVGVETASHEKLAA